MPSRIDAPVFVCYQCLSRGLAGKLRTGARRQTHGFTTTSNRPDGNGGKDADEKGAMSRRLEEMTNQSLEEGGKRARKSVQDAGFSEDLKKRLEKRIAGSDPGEEGPAASATLSMPSSAGRGTRDMATAKPWMGSESVEDASLRMLNDAHKPLRPSRSSRLASPGTPSLSVDTRMKQAVKKSSGTRLANARDKTSIYAISQDPNLSEKEKEDMRKLLKEQFQPGARPLPATLQGLSSLANERIEDAIARGQFKNIPRGKGVNKEVDYNANSPFLNTTEYFMNKMIQRQDIVPPWIEKQQEVAKTAQAFRARLRNDWRRHAARMIASRGGSLADQVLRAEAHATAEAELNPKPPKVEAVSRIDSTGRLTQINIVETLTGPVQGGTESTITVVETAPGERDEARVVADAVTATAVSQTPLSIGKPDNDAANSPAASSSHPPPTLILPPFRDTAWEKTELAYHSAALKELNSLTRSYNLMAPELAKKPYYSLNRELASCFADVAPQLADHIRERARRPDKFKVEIIGHKPGSVLERFGGERAKVYDSKKPNYGFKELLREFWNRGDDKRL